VERAAIQQSGVVAVDDPGPPGFGSFEKSRGFYHHFAFALPFGLASTHAGVWQCRPAVTLSGRLTSGARSRALAVPSFSGPLHQPGAGIPAGTDEMSFVLHLLSHGTSWRRQDFLGFSYGFRPGRSAHDALDALAVGIARRKVNFVLDADIRDFFTRLDQGWLERFLEHRIADERVLRLIQKWLRAGVIEDGEWSKTEAGTAQGAGSGASRRCRAYARWFARPCPPNRTCPFLSIRLSTGHAVADRDAGLCIRGFRRGGGPSCSGVRCPW